MQVYVFDIEKFESEYSTCENCKHFEYDIHLDGDQFFFCNIQEINQKQCKPCIFHEKY